MSSNESILSTQAPPVWPRAPARSSPGNGAARKSPGGREPRRRGGVRRRRFWQTGALCDASSLPTECIPFEPGPAVRARLASASPWGCPWRLDRRCLARTRRATRTSAPPGYRSRERLACCGGLLNQAGPDRWPARWPADRAKKCCRGSPRSLACQPLRKLQPFCQTRRSFTRSFELRMALKSFFRSSVYSVAFGDGSVSILQIFL